MKSRYSFLLTSLSALLAAACGDDEASGPLPLPANAAEAVQTYSNVVYASYRDSLTAAEDLDAAIAELVATPTAATQEAAQDAWRASREPYLQTEVYRFYDGPIDREGGPEGLLNAWPLDEEHIDYIVTDPDAGIINDPQMTIDPPTLEGANESPTEKDISTGYHAIEFLLWGQDLDDNGPGARPFTDYMLTDGTNANQDRRGEYITVASQMLVGHLDGLVEEWEDTGSSYRASFEEQTPAEALGKILSGMIILSGFETGGERLEAALLARDEEEEHSCFSDNTHRDMVQDVRGVQNVWLGEYDGFEGDISGTSVRDVIAAGDAGLAQQITDQIAESLALAEDLVPPFDREILPGNTAGEARVQALIDALFRQQELLEEAFELYGLTRIPDPV